MVYKTQEETKGMKEEKEHEKKRWGKYRTTKISLLSMKANYPLIYSEG